MSSGGNSSGSEKMFFCYQCNRTVTISISISSTADPFCPLCNGGFLEEYEDPNPSPSGGFVPMADPFTSLLPLLFGSSASPSPTIDAFDPVSFLQNHLQHLRSSGTHVQFVIEDHPLDPGHRVPGNLGDYFFGPGLEQLIQQLAENDPNRYGTPPASKSAIDALPTVKVSKDMFNSEMNQCAVCMDDFEPGTDVKQMPCNHVFHQDCLLPWLHLHNSCPVCRFELPTDDPDYETSAHTTGDPVQAQGQQRRFSIQLPWPFRREDASGSGTGPTRQEDLD